MGLLRIVLRTLLLALCLGAGVGYAAGPREYEVKAVFLFNFSQFVDWPDGAFGDERSPLVIGVLGEDPFGAALDEAVRGETVNGRPLAVRRYEKVEDVDACHILFIDRTQREQLERILDTLTARSCLTVSDAENFATAGGIIQFVTIDNRIRLQINLDAAKLANLTISSKLLRPAQIVTTRRAVSG
jgi:hypothetical protein